MENSRPLRIQIRGADFTFAPQTTIVDIHIIQPVVVGSSHVTWPIRCTKRWKEFWHRERLP